MTRQYKVEVSPSGNETISYEENGIHISFIEDPFNLDYQQYLAWKVEQANINE